MQFPRNSPPLVILGAQQVSRKPLQLLVGLPQRFLGPLQAGDVEHGPHHPRRLAHAVAGDYGPVMDVGPLAIGAQ